MLQGMQEPYRKGSSESILTSRIPPPRVLHPLRIPASTPLIFVRAVSVDALVRLCAGAISDDRPYRDSCYMDLRSASRTMERLRRLFPDRKVLSIKRSAASPAALIGLALRDEAK
jgi:hypothetical protein